MYIKEKIYISQKTKSYNYIYIVNKKFKNSNIINF